MTFSTRFPGFRLRLTRWGTVFLVAMLLVGVAAVNTGNNALMALLGLALGSGTWSRQVLAGVTVNLRPPRELFAGRPTTLEAEVRNRCRLFPAYGLLVREPGGRALLLDALLAPGGTSRHALDWTFDRRGWHELATWRLEVLLPLGFFVKSKQLAGSGRVLVYPRLLHAAAVAGTLGGGKSSVASFAHRGREGDVSQLRDFRQGDERRQIHWKQTARQQRMIVVERQRQAETPVFLVLDPRLADPDEEASRERFEQLVSLVATAVVEYLRAGQAVGLVVGRSVAGPVSSLGMAGLLLRPLAEVEPQLPSADAPATVAGVRSVLYRVEAAA